MKYLALLALLISPLAYSQTFTATPATGSGPRTITWDVPGGTNCQAGGDWSGSKAASGSESIKLAVGDHTLTLACTVPDNPIKATVTLLWTAPTQNVDGTALTDLAGFKLYYGTSATALSQTISINNPAQNVYKVEDLNPGTWFFALTALNSTGIESAKSATVNKALTETPTTKPWTGTVSTTVVAGKPKAPVLRFETAP